MGILNHEFINETGSTCSYFGKQPGTWKFVNPNDKSYGFYVEYPGQTNQILRISFGCDEKVGGKIISFDNFTQDSTNVLLFQISTKHACQSNETNSKLSGGWIFIIIISCGSVLYCGIGIGYKGIFKKSKGVNIIPNLTFWKDFPSLIGDGFALTFTCKKRFQSYQEV
eukprot:Anaeramoba_ignava/a95577_11.p1 GENE.a95577_11~~a95577_11.p1  ORF type:complete len:168 (-),score=40.30 a95577_11:97-600(-)